MKLTREEVLDRLTHGDGNKGLSGSDLTGIDLSRLDLRGVDLSRADLSAADLRWAVLEGADLHASVLRRADFRWAILRDANLRQADLGRANLSWADVRGADFTGATLEGANLENADVAGAALEQPRKLWGGGGGRGGAAAARPMAVPRARPLAIAAGIVGLVALVFAWGWLFQKSYFGAFGVDDPAVVSLSSPANLMAGLHVVLLTLKTLLVSPLILIALAAILLVAVVIPAVLILLGDRVLKDLGRPQMRLPALILLFVVYFLVAWLVLLPVLGLVVNWLLDNALPAEKGLRAAFALATRGFIFAAGFVGVVIAAVYLAWLGWRLLSRVVQERDLSPSLRLRYPRLNAGYVGARASRLFRRSDPLTEPERRYGTAALAVVGLMLPTLLSQTGAVEAYHDMCDGGNMPRVQLYANRAPEQPPADADMCARLLAQTDETTYVFFPSETTRTQLKATPEPPPEATPEAGAPAGDAAAPASPTTEVVATPEMDDPRKVDHEPVVYGVPQSDIVKSYVSTSETDTCPTCMDGPTGTERHLIDPDEVAISGVVAGMAGNLVTLDEAQGQMSSFEVQPDTSFRLAGRPVGHDLGVAALTAGARVQALGTASTDGPYLLARRVAIQPTIEQVLNPTLSVSYPSARSFIVAGSDWKPGSTLAVGLGDVNVSPPAPQVPLVPDTIVVQDDGTFSAPMEYLDVYPTGPEWQLVVRDQRTGVARAAVWLKTPPPTSTPTVTPPPAPTEGAAATPTTAGTPEAEPTNTRLVPSGIATLVDCTIDDYEYDNTVGTAKEIYVAFAEGSAQSHTFCPNGDLDIVTFEVKPGRWYKVFTANLAPGVDTVMQVGNLSFSTPCQPAGCWNDDAGPLTYASEVIFQSIEYATAVVTVDNFGAYPETATYELSVVEFVPEATPTVTPQPSGTATRTPTPSATPKPFGDLCDDQTVQNNTCQNACLLGFEPYYGTISRSTDLDWFESIVLQPGSYRVYMQPPEGSDFDLQVYEPGDPNRTTCAGNLYGQSRNPGDEAEQIDLTLAAPATFYVRVAGADANQMDLHNPYVLQIQPLTPPATPVPTATLTFTPRPTATGTPTLVIPVP